MYIVTIHNSDREVNPETTLPDPEVRAITSRCGAMASLVNSRGLTLKIRTLKIRKKMVEPWGFEPQLPG